MHAHVTQKTLCVLLCCRYAASRRLPKPLKVKLSKHFKYYLAHSSVFDESELLGQCPPALRYEVTRSVLDSKPPLSHLLTAPT